MSIIFFKIGNTDFSEAVDRQNYAVDNETVTVPWTDINGTEHRDFVRTRLTGRFTLGYSDATAFAAAISAISSAVATNGYASCSVYANNDGTTHTADCYLTLRGGAKYDFTNDRQWQTVDVELLER